MTENERKQILEIINDIDDVIDVYEEHTKSVNKPQEFGKILKRFIQNICKFVANLIRQVIR